MRIMMLSWEYPPRIVGGIARVVHDLSHNFAKQGHEVHVITYQEGDTKEFGKDGYVFVQLNMKIDNGITVGPFGSELENDCIWEKETIGNKINCTIYLQ